MSTISIPTSSDIFNTEQLLYVSVRRKGRRSKYTEWNRNTPIAMLLPNPLNLSDITTPSFKTIFVPDANVTDPSKHSLWISTEPYVSTLGTICDHVEYEIYKNFDENGNLLHRLVAYGIDSSAPRFLIDTDTMKTLYQYDEFYIRSRFVDTNNNKSAWSKFLHVIIKILTADAPQVLTPAGTEVIPGSMMEISRPAVIDQHDEDVTGMFNPVVIPTVYAEDGTVLFEGNPVMLPTVDDTNNKIKFSMGAEIYSNPLFKAQQAVDITYKCQYGYYQSPESDKFRVTVPAIDQPTVIDAPARGYVILTGQSVTVNTTPFVSNYTTDEHVSTEWIVSTDEAGQNVVSTLSSNA